MSDNNKNTKKSRLESMFGKLIQGKNLNYTMDTKGDDVNLVISEDIRDKKASNYRGRHSARKGTKRTQTTKSRVLQEIKQHGTCKVTNLYDGSIEIILTPGKGVRTGTPGKVGYIDGRTMRPVRARVQGLVERMKELNAFDEVAVEMGVEFDA